MEYSNCDFHGYHGDCTNTNNHYTRNYFYTVNNSVCVVLIFGLYAINIKNIGSFILLLHGLSYQSLGMPGVNFKNIVIARYSQPEWIIF